MKVTPAILQHEFIGLKAKVVESKNPYYKGIEGRVVDETRNTFTILHEGEKKIIVKDVAVFHFTLPDGTVVEVDGRVLVGRPEDRVKRRVRRRW
ncbi:ribonuclease P protein subunit [Candidatus Bathyarchaeota archaeon]|nr:MAG: ribonuclease P protein subunit [Candidatus Bathyarchaeota archaeon]RJS77747.1 MAG: ribonuclease P protein subunit [Candidatus Bathyarchaeota archaeon]HDJ04907.1 ribonuclease P protein subunit [Candidatus Bathyarchaeota archaeon]